MNKLTKYDPQNWPAIRNCGECGKAHKGTGRKCTACYRRAQRAEGRAPRLSEEERLKGIARAYVNVYKRRGKIEIKNCEVCGEKAEMHHEDYGKPLEVKWLCRAHHMQEHDYHYHMLNLG